MAFFKSNLANIVCLGRQNPQILNIDFLLNNKLIPVNVHPFNKFDFEGYAKNHSTQPFSEFISTPVLTSIKFEPISIIVEESRFVISDSSGNIESTPIFDIATKYFVETLKYTPLTAVGINLNGVIRFEDAREEDVFNTSIGINNVPLGQFFPGDKVRIGMIVRARWNKGIVEIQIFNTANDELLKLVNFNYEVALPNTDFIMDVFRDRMVFMNHIRAILEKYGVKHAPH